MTVVGDPAVVGEVEASTVEQVAIAFGSISKASFGSMVTVLSLAATAVATTTLLFVAEELGAFEGPVAVVEVGASTAELELAPRVSAREEA